MKPGGGSGARGADPAAAGAGTLKKQLVRYLFGVCAVGVAFGVREALSLAVGPDFPEYLVFYPTVMIVALVTGLWPALFAIATTAGMIVAFWAIPLRGRLLPLTTSNFVSLALFVGVCAFLSLVAELYRRNREKAAAYDKEEALRESHAVLRQQADLLKLSFDAIIVWRTRGGIESWNRGAEELYGFSEQEALGRDIRDLLRTRYPTAWTEFEGVLRGRRYWEGELNHVTKGGDEVVVFSRLHIGSGPDEGERVLEIDRDITEQKRVQQELQRAHDELEDKVQRRTSELRKTNRMLRMVSRCDEALVQATDEGDLTAVISQIIHDEGGYPLAWVGISETRDESRLRCAASAGDHDLGGFDPPAVEGPALEAVRSGAAVISAGEVAREGSVSPRRPMAVAAFPLLDLGGAAFGALVICSDRPAEFDSTQVSLLKELADDLAFGLTSLDARKERDEAERALELKAAQLRALAGEIVRTEQRERQRIAQLIHDNLQQLLAATLYGLASLSTRSRVRREEELKALREQLRDCITISRSLSSEISHPAFSEPDLVAALEWLVTWTRDKHGLEVHLEPGRAVGAVPGETRIMLLQAARELLFNVVKHANVKSAWVRLDQDPQGLVKITVRDEGVGFDTASLVGVGRGPGGIGLFSVRERLALAGGGLEVTSSPGNGTRVTIWAPAAQPDGGRAAAMDAPPSSGIAPRSAPPRAPLVRPPGEGAAIRILLVDDHVVVRKGIGLQLAQQQDMQVVGEASDGETGIQLARELKPDIVTMDVNMPGMGGIRAVGVLHAELPELPVIGLSMIDEPTQTKAILDSGAVGYVCKSAGAETLIAAIRAHARRPGA
ncbi:MAG TPA: response regulator [Spirochaetia bacterium]|nr:response regulator [Spirochaetia bacterium]